MVNLFSYIATSLYDASHPLSSYIPIASFSKLVWLLTIFFTYSFYPLTHCTQICRRTTWLIHAILFGQQFDIGKSFFIMTPYRDPFFQFGGLSFSLFVSSILENIRFNLEHAKRVQASHTSLDKNLWAKCYSDVYGPMAPQAP